MTENIKRRRPLNAALLSFLMLGLGHLYNGQVRRALVLFAISTLPSILLLTFSQYLFSYEGVIAIYVAVLIGVVLSLFVAFNAFTSARRIGALKLHRYNRWYVYISLIIVMELIRIPIEIPIGSYSIPSRAMFPNLLVGDYLHVNKAAYQNRIPERGDVAVFKKPTNNTIEYIERIVGLPGDQINVQQGILHINNKPVIREHAGVYAYTDA